MFYIYQGEIMFEERNYIVNDCIVKTIVYKCC